MLRNFIVDSDLKKYYPNFARYIPSTQTDWSTQIAEAFNLVMDDFLNKGLDPRRLGTMVDLNRALSDSSGQDTLKSLTKTTAYNGTWIQGMPGFKRLVFNITAITGSATLKLQGSNDIDVDEDTEPVNWTDIVTVAATTTGEIGTNVITREFQWYRLVVTPGTTVTWTAGMAEVYIDRLIVWRSFNLIFTNLSKEDGDVWSTRAKESMDNYLSALSSSSFYFDSDANNLVNGDDVVATGQARFTR